MVERFHQRLEQILKINVSADYPQWDKYVNLAVMAHNTTYHQSLECTPSEVFHVRIPHDGMRNKRTDRAKLVDQLNEKYKQSMTTYSTPITRTKGTMTTRLGRNR